MICLFSTVLGQHFYYGDIFDKPSDGKLHYSLNDVFIFAMYPLGVCIGSIICGTYRYSWPVRSINVRYTR